MLLDKPALEKYLPHKGPMLILDRLIGEDLAVGLLQSEVDIHDDVRFFRPSMGGVPVWVGFEYMAQTIAALSGRQAAVADGHEPRIGFIMGIRDFDCSVGVFSRNSVLRIEVVQEFRDGPVVSFSCRILCAGATVVSAMVNAIEVDDTNVYELMGEGCNG